MARTPERTPDWLLERIALGELPAGELERARARLLAEPDGAERLAALERDSRQMLAAHAPDAVLAEVRRRVHLLRTREAHARGRRPGAAAWLGVPLVAALAALVVWTGQGAGGDTPDGEGPRSPVESPLGSYSGIKGKLPSLVVHRQTAAGTAERLREGAQVRAGDTLQLGYVAAGAAYGAVVSVDGRGAVTVHLPEHGGRAAALEPGKTGSAVSLPSAYQLDDAPAFERFFFVTAPAPFEVAQVRQAAERLVASGAARDGALPLPAGGQWTQSSLVVEKATP